MSAPKVSVIIPLYYAEEYVDALLAQLREQPLKEIEIICVVDGSPDGTLDIVKRHAVEDERIKWICQENAGAGAARNAGLERAEGEYLVFLDADDSYDPQLLTKMYEAAREHDADLVVCQFERVDFKTGKRWANEGFRSDAVPTGTAFSAQELERPFTDFVVIPNNKLFRKTMVERAGLRFSTTRVANDIYFSLAAIASAERIVAIPDSLVAQRKFISPQSISSHRAEHSEDVIESFCDLRTWLIGHGLFERYRIPFAEAWASAVHYNAYFGRNERLIQLAAEELACEEPWRSMSDDELQRTARLDPSMIAVKRLVYAWQPDKTAREVEVQNLRNEEGAVTEIIQILNAEYGRSLSLHTNALMGIIAHIRRLGLRDSMGKMLVRMRRGR